MTLENIILMAGIMPYAHIIIHFTISPLFVNVGF